MTDDRQTDGLSLVRSVIRFAGVRTQFFEEADRWDGSSSDRICSSAAKRPNDRISEAYNHLVDWEF